MVVDTEPGASEQEEFLPADVELDHVLVARNVLRKGYRELALEYLPAEALASSGLSARELGQTPIYEPKAAELRSRSYHFTFRLRNTGLYGLRASGTLCLRTDSVTEQLITSNMDEARFIFESFCELEVGSTGRSLHWTYYIGRELAEEGQLV